MSEMTREEAKTALGDRNNLLWGMSKEEQKYYSEALDMAISALSADVRPNIHGHWKKINSGDEDFPESIVCDRCNHENSHLDFNEHNEPIGKVFVTSNFCPNCGADMRGNANE